jgi:hyaluronan synthase
LIVLGAVVAGIGGYKVLLLRQFRGDLVVAAYIALAAGYLLSRFALAFAYRAPRDRGIEPTVTVVMPAFNEEEAIAASLRSLLAVDYPAEKLEIVMINDGSTDGTLDAVGEVAREAPDHVR